jgi:hypothetical protein
MMYTNLILVRLQLILEATSTLFLIFLSSQDRFTWHEVAVSGSEAPGT